MKELEEVKLFKELLKLANYINPKDSEYKRIYIGEVEGFKNKTLFDIFIKKDLRLSKPKYKKILEDLIFDQFLFPIEDTEIYILNPLAVAIIEDNTFNIN